MDPIQKDKLVTYIVIVFVILSIVANGAIVYLHNSGSIDMQTMLVYSTVISVAMFGLIFAFMIYSYRTRPKLLEFKKQRDGVRDEQDPPQNE